MIESAPSTGNEASENIRTVQPMASDDGDNSEHPLAFEWIVVVFYVCLILILVAIFGGR